MKPRPRLEEKVINQLLSRRYRDTSPEFEVRWTNLRRELRQAPPRRVWPVSPAWRWGGVMGVLGMIAAIALVIHLGRPPAPVPSVALVPAPRLAELLVMDQTLVAALPLLDAENRDALLHLPENR